MVSGRTPRRRLLSLLGSVAAVLVAVPAVVAVSPAADAAGGYRWRDTDTGSESHFRGLAAVSAKVAWAGGYDGTIIRTADGGRTWQDVSPGLPGTEALQFRDIEAWDSRNAVALAVGEGTDSRIYRTSDGGKTWKRGYQNRNPKAFYDCMSFWDRRHGITVGDPVNGRLAVLVTNDGGRSWDKRPGPAALKGEAGFAASGQCTVTAGKSDAWFGGGGPAARVFHTEDRGRTWSVTETPIAAGETGGINGLLALDRRHLMAVGGDFGDAEVGARAAAYSNDGGDTWAEAGALRGYRSSVALVPGTEGTFVAVGLTGSDVSRDGGLTWRKVDNKSLDTIDCTADVCWGSGDLGRIAVLTER